MRSRLQFNRSVRVSHPQNRQHPWVNRRGSSRPLAISLAALALAVFTGPLTGCASDGSSWLGGSGPVQDVAPPAQGSVRVATFNAAMSGESPFELEAAIASRNDEKLKAIAQIIQRVRPDILLLQEFDVDPTGRLAREFVDHYLKVPQSGSTPIDYAYRYSPEANTGIPSGVDLNNDGELTIPQDAHGWGAYPGQYGMVVLSRFPIRAAEARSFRKLRWRDMPRNLMPRQHYSREALSLLRLSSKTHEDVPVTLPGGVDLHLLISHPTPPVFDGPEDRNGRRNHDEIRLWADYLSGGQDAAYLGAELPAEALAIVMGDMNADPADGESVPGSIQQLLDHPRLRAGYIPDSRGAVADTRRDGRVNTEHRTLSAHDTADFSEPPGNLRVDYVIPSTGLAISGKGVYWPERSETLLNLASDHRLVWIDVRPGLAQ